MASARGNGRVRRAADPCSRSCMSSTTAASRPAAWSWAASASASCGAVHSAMRCSITVDATRRPLQRSRAPPPPPTPAQPMARTSRCQSSSSNARRARSSDPRRRTGRRRAARRAASGCRRGRTIRRCGVAEQPLGEPVDAGSRPARGRCTCRARCACGSSSAAAIATAREARRDRVGDGAERAERLAIGPAGQVVEPGQRRALPAEARDRRAPDRSAPTGRC